MAIAKVEVFGTTVQINYLDGSREEVEGGIYERKNTAGRTVEQRAATPADLTRLTDLAAAFEAANPINDSPIVEVERLGTSVEIKFADGSKVEIAAGIYELKDTNNKTILERAATPADSAALEQLISGETPITGGTGGDTGGGTIVTPPALPVIEGTAADNRIEGTRAGEEILGLDGNDRLRGRSGDDIVDGGNGNDEVRGDGGNDIIKGGAGNDRVRGDAGNDTVDGGTGRDDYWGGLGQDVLVFARDGVRDTIHDFENGLDKVDLTAFGLTDLDARLASAVERGGDVYLDLGGGDVIKFDDTLKSALDASDFLV